MVITEEDLLERFPDMTPTSKCGVPSLASVNGFGLMVYGKQGFDQDTGTYITTRCFTLLFVPVLCIDAWRVADLRNGNLAVIGRVPVRGVAWAWNRVMLSVVVVGALAIGWGVYTNSPGYIARQTLAQAKTQHEQGREKEALTTYQRAVHSIAPYDQQARDAIAAIAKGIPQRPVAEHLPLIRQILAISKHERGISDAEILTMTSSLMERPDQSGDAAMAMFDLLSQRNPALKKGHVATMQKLAKLHPAEVGIVSRLAEALEADDQRADCEALLEPVRAKLGTTEAARILGQIDAEAGRTTASYALLSPYFAKRLADIKQTANAYEQAREASSTRHFNALNRGEAGDAWYKKYEKANEAAKSQMVSEWIAPRIDKDPAVVQAEAALTRMARVVGAAMDFGMVIIEHAQASLAEERPALYKQAEQVFVGVQALVGESDTFQVGLGQVKYWLGQADEGKALFDALLAKHKRSAETLVVVASLLRQVGAQREGSQLLEEAWAKTTKKEEKEAIASQIASFSTTVEDSTLWLSRAGDDIHVQASRAANKADQLIKAGDTPKAIAALEEAAALYAKIPVSTSALNNRALVSNQLFSLTSKPTYLDQGTADLEAALALEPSDTVIASNLIYQLKTAANFKAIGTRVDQAQLSMVGDGDLLELFIVTEADYLREEAAKASLEESKRIAVLSNRLVVLSPQNPLAWAQVWGLAKSRQDYAALRELAQRLETVDLAYGDMAHALQAKVAEKESGTLKVAMARSRQEEMEAILARIDISKEMRTEALVEWVNSELSVAMYRIKPNFAQCAKYLEEAQTNHPCLRLSDAQIYLAAAQILWRLREGDAWMEQQWQRLRLHFNATLLLALALDHGGSTAEALKKDSDLSALRHLIAEHVRRLPSQVSGHHWRLLMDQAPDAALAVAALKTTSCDGSLLGACAKLAAYSAPGLVDLTWQMQALGRHDEAAALLKAARERKLPLPID